MYMKVYDEVLRWFLIYLVLSNHTQMHIRFTLFENHKEPPLLSDREKWRSGKKSDILEWLNHQSCKLSTIRRMSFLNICPEHEIGVHNNQT